jgi:protein-S-isoprenylcysteine O-methyltransferase Ste14
MTRAFVRARAFLLIVAVWAGIGFSLGFLPRIDRSLGLELPSWVRTPAAIAIGVGGTLMLACGLMLSTVGIGALSGEDRLLPRDFIVHGPFRFVRNPMSLGGIILMVGFALWLRSTLALAAAALLFLVFHLVVILVEEPGLERRFGDSYRRYRLNVLRWAPRFRPWIAEQASEAKSN